MEEADHLFFCIQHCVIHVHVYYLCASFAEMCVVSMRGPDGNDVPTLVVVPAQAGLSEDELERTVAHLRAAAPARCRVAGHIRSDEPLPRTPLGKIRRRALAEALTSRRSAPHGPHGQ